MKFSTKSRYALRLMIDLALSDRASSISLKDISQRQDISVKYLEQIVSLLTKAGLLLSTRGAQGGYRLAKKASAITAGDILRATEGSLAPIPCLEKGYNACSRVKDCTTIDFWSGLYQALDSYLEGVTLDELVRAQQEVGLDYSI